MTDAQTAVLLVMTNAPDRETAHRIARGLIDARLAACVNVMSPCTSLYRWQSAVESAEEIPMLIKTTAQRYGDVEKLIRSLHPYELPEIVAVTAARGLPDYLAWVAAESTGDH